MLERPRNVRARLNRPDIVSAARYWSAFPCGEAPAPEGTPDVLSHSLHDGTFSASDEVAAAFLRARCPSAPAALLTSDDCGGFAARGNIACARAWGATADEVRAQLVRERAGLSPPARDDLDQTTDWDTLTAFVAIDPPVVLRATP